MVTGALYQPLASGARSGAPVTTGGWSSTITVPVVALKMMYACRSPVIGCSLKGMTRPLLRTMRGLARVMPSGTGRVVLPLASRAAPLLG